MVRPPPTLQQAICCLEIMQRSECHIPRNSIPRSDCELKTLHARQLCILALAAVHMALAQRPGAGTGCISAPDRAQLVKMARVAAVSAAVRHGSASSSQRRRRPRARVRVRAYIHFN